MTEDARRQPPQVAVVGIGQMGGGIARNLHAAGLLGGVFDSDRDVLAASGLPDATRFAPLQDLADSADIILFAVPGTRQIADALSGIDLPAGLTVIDVTTSAPAESRALAAALAARDVGYLDAAMTGGAVGADAGRLTLMVGGDAAQVSRCGPVFDAIAEKVFHLGPTGSGHAMKLVHNMILHSSFLATCEGLMLAERAGLDVATAVDVLNAGNARSYVTQTRFPRDILSGNMQARSSVSNLEKDLGLAVDFGEGLGARLPFARLSRSFLAAAAGAGQREADFAWLYPLFEDVVAEMEGGS